MSTQAIDLEHLGEVCGAARPGQGLEALVACVDGAVDGLGFRHVLSDEDWYRLGGVVDRDGRRIAGNLEEWAEDQSGGDAIELMARFGESGYRATQVRGKTHYLSARSGDGQMDFVQLEVEEIQEVVIRDLFQADAIPDTLEDVIDPMEFVALEPEPVGEPRYVFKSATALADVLGELTSEYSGDPRFRRLVEEWEDTSAGHAARFADHWVVTTHPYQDSMGNHLVEVRPVSTHVALAARLRALGGNGNLASGEVLALDQEAGFPMAWYFLLVTENYLPYSRVETLSSVLAPGAGGLGLLPERDFKVLRGWIEDPYHL